jgi:hypothetical protein
VCVCVCVCVCLRVFKHIYTQVAVMMKSTLEQLEKSHMEIVVATKRELASVREERGALVARLKSGEALVLEVQQHLELASLDLEESFAGVKVDFDDVERGTRAMEVHKMALQERVAALSGAVHSNLNGACQELELVREETEALLETIKVVRAEMREEKCVAELRLKEQEDSLNAHRRWGATRGQQIQRCDSEIKELQRQLIIVSWGRDEAVGARRAAEAARDAAVAECTAVTAEVDAWKEKLCVCKAGAQMLRAQLQLEGPPEEEGSLSLSLSFLSSLWQTELERGHGAQEHAAGEPEESVQGAVEELEVEVEEAKGWRRVLQERLREAA